MSGLPPTTAGANPLLIEDHLTQLLPGRPSFPYKIANEARRPEPEPPMLSCLVAPR